MFFLLVSMSLSLTDQLCPRKNFIQNSWQPVYARGPDSLSSSLGDALCGFFKDSSIEQVTSLFATIVYRRASSVSCQWLLLCIDHSLVFVLGAVTFFSLRKSLSKMNPFSSFKWKWNKRCWHTDTLLLRSRHAILRKFSSNHAIFFSLNRQIF